MESVDISCGWVVCVVPLSYTRAVSIVIGIVLLVAFVLLGFEHLRPRLVSSFLVTSIIFALTVGAFWAGYAVPLRGLVTGNPAEVDPWHVFHYDLNARYLDELRYEYLYSCALKADEEGPNHWQSVQVVRDLRTYELVPRASLTPCPKTEFSQERWNVFKADVIGIGKNLHVPNLPGYESWQQDDEIYWRAIFQDKGYNVSPFGARLTGLALEYSGFTRWEEWKTIFIIELFVFLLSIIALARWYSARAASLFALFIVSFWGTYPFLVNMLWQHLWLPLTIFGLLAWRKQKEGITVVFLLLASFLRVFPAFFLVPVLVSLYRGESKKSLSNWRIRGHVSLLILTIVVTLIDWSGSFSLWHQYLEKIGHHRAFLAQEAFNIGWPTLAHLMAPNFPFIAILGSILLTAIYFYLTRNATMWQRTLLIPVLICAWLSMSPYYYLILPLLVLLGPTMSRRGAWYSVSALILVFAGHAFAGVYGLSYFTDQSLVHIPSELSILGLFLFHLWLVAKEAKPIELFPPTA